MVFMHEHIITYVNYIFKYITGLDIVIMCRYVKYMVGIVIRAEMLFIWRVQHPYDYP